MEHFRVKTITESDFDSIVVEAGGSRIDEEGAADYVLNEALVELKLVDEEGFDKVTRQQKIAKLFAKQQPAAPVVVIDPQTLDEAGSRDYYNIVAGPIQTHVKKAASQLEKTRLRRPECNVSVLVMLNNGYSALSREEFKSVCLKCARNDTRQIDWVIVGGMYYYGDTFDNYFIAPFEAVAINLNTAFPSDKELQKAWGLFIERLMTSLVRGELPIDNGKFPVMDLTMNVDGITLIKPAPKMGESKFWPNGRPRENSTGIVRCPPVAETIPSFSQPEWHKFKTALPSIGVLKGSHEEWVQCMRKEESNSRDNLRPLVPISVQYDSFNMWCKTPEDSRGWDDVSEFANELFHRQIRKIIERAVDSDELKIVVSEYIHVLAKEIGQDKANDLCSIIHVSEYFGESKERTIVENARMFYEHGVALASAYALKLNVGVVVFTRDKSASWT